METTLFSNEGRSYQTRLDGTDLVMEGSVNIETGGVHKFNGSIRRISTGEYVGSYSSNNLQLNEREGAKATTWVEVAQLMDQLSKDIDTKAKEVQL